jgi:hypothetical protein
VLAEMDRVGVDFCIDVHGDEVLPYNFLSGSEGLPKWGPRLKHLQDKFAAEYLKVRLVGVCIHCVFDTVFLILCF